MSFSRISWDEFRSQKSLDIETVNENVKLLSLFNKINLNLQPTNSSNNWKYKTNCPFPDHFDDSPSFGYHVKDDRFHCFGCNRGGRAVQFWAYLNRISFKESIEILSSSFKLNLDILKKQDTLKENTEKNFHLLFEFSKFIKEHVDLSLADKILLNLDLYLEYSDRINSLDLENRIKILKEYLCQKS